MRTLLALIPALAFVALPQPAAAFELPNGDVVWDVATADFDVRIEQTHGSELGSMTLTKRATGEIQYGDLSPAFIYDRDGSQPYYFKHLGIYAYRKAVLEQFVTLPESSLERAERLEQLRFLENGVPIYAAETPYDSIGVDTDEDLARVTKILSA
jgi:hypothetical protein